MTPEEAQAIIKANMKDMAKIVQDAIGVLHPELAESEDERMCKRCIDLLRKVSAYSGEEYLGVEIADCIIWLQALRKKQKESLHISETCKENADSFTDENERIRKALYEFISDTLGDEFDGYDFNKNEALAYLEKQKEITMPNSTELIEMWHKAKAILKEKDFRGDEWRLAQNAFMDGFARGTCIKFEKQKEPNARQRLAEWSKTEEGKAKYEEVAKEMREEINEEQKPELTEFEEKVGQLIGYYPIATEENKGSLIYEVRKAATELFELAKKELEQKPAEWSEEEEQMFGSILNHYSLIEAPTDGNGISKERYLAFIKSLRPQPKQGWSKEDENKIERLAFLVSVAAEKEMISSEECIDLRRFVKSYHPQSKQEWSEEDRDKVAQYLHDRDGGMLWSKATEITSDILDILRPSWRPSEEQMTNLINIRDYVGRRSGYWGEALDSLIEDLNKLM